MVEGIRETLRAWRDDVTVKAVLLKGNGGRAFCSGGDVKGCRETLMEDPASPAPADLVFCEYNLLFEMEFLQKPSVAIAEGVTMGFGLGLASFCRYTVATDTTRMAMPESNIGLFPDVGFSYRAANFLPPGVGRLLAVTDADGAVRACLAGLAAPPAGRGRLSAHAALVEAFARAPGGPGGLAQARGALEAEATAAGGWAAELQAGMPRCCPFSQAVAWSLLCAAEADRGAGELEWRAAAALERDFAAACRLFRRPDFCEGVRAVLVDKGRVPAAWAPAATSDVSEEEVAAAVAPLPEGERRLGLPGA
ncbi:unnamed protein product [Prorocentrum cordatum]|uniref:Enoyl-CoA hydratase/isomerase domain-containing protein n=1 Tax=Prorocentrum cordatum TaxID=2364126 RepID=A0ABN9R6W7_9DINO|nr:unnamed protein product [Polarella glacialis]